MTFQLACEELEFYRCGAGEVTKDEGWSHSRCLGGQYKAV